MRINNRTLSLALVVVLTVMAVRVVAGDPVQGFVDGVVAGFTNGV